MAEFDFIFGEAGAGKSTYVYDWLSREAAAHPDQSFVLFVPEQNTLKAQREIVRISDVSGMLNLDVLSFQLLFYRVMEELGAEKPLVLDDIAKSLLIRKAALEAQKSAELKVYAKKLTSRGFIEQLKSLISEFFQYGIDAEKLELAIEHAESPLLKDKLSDIKNIYEHFTAHLAEAATIPEEIPVLLYQRLAQSTLLKDAVLVFDGFTGFTPIQLKLLSLLLPMARRSRFVVTIPLSAEPYRFKKEDITDLYWLSKKTVATVIDTASKAGVRQADARHIELRTEENPAQKLRPIPETTILTASDPAEEVRTLAANIRRAARFDGVRYKRMAVVVSEPAGYRELLKRELTRAEIPFFMDDKTAAIGSPAVELVRSAFAMVVNHYKYDDIMRFSKNPLVSSVLEDRAAADELDNRLRRMGTRGRKALDRVLEDQVQAIVGTDALAAAFRPVFHLEDSLKEAADVQGKTAAAAAFFAEIRLNERMEALAARLEEMGLLKEAFENRRFLTLIDQLFSRLSEVLGSEPITTAEYQKLIEAGFIDMKGGMIPEMMDMVIVGDLKRSRLDDIDILFVLGANDGLLPSQVTGGGIFTDHERIEIEMLNAALPQEQRFELAPDDKLDSCISNFYLHLLMHKPNHKLIFSYAKTGSDGKSLKPSSVLSTLRGSVACCSADPEAIASGEDALELLAALVRETGTQDPRIKTLYRELTGREEYRLRAEQILKGAFITHQRDKLSRQAAEELYSRVLSGSVSRLEAFEGCPFSHFLQYGLRLKTREQYDVEAMDIGNLYHSALDEVFRMAEERKQELTEIPGDVLSGMCSQAVDKVTGEYGDRIMQASARNRYITERVRKITDRTVWALKEQLKNGDFHTLGTEIPFFFKDENLKLSGKIDRVDYVTHKESSKTFVKVIDYKTGNTQFDISLVLNGLQLQLTAYMDRAVQEVSMKVGSREGVVPAGMFYYHIDDPVVEFEAMKGVGDTPELSKREQLKLKELKMNGAVADSSDALKHLEQTLETGGTETYDAKLLKKSGILGTGTMPLSENAFRNLIQKTRERMKEDAARILDGEIEAKPYRYGGRSKCDYCSFKGICGFDTSIKGCTYRSIRKMKPEEVFETLEGELAP